MVILLNYMQIKNKLYKFVEKDLILDENVREYILKIKDLPEDNKPREKLIKLGAEALSNEELLSIVLNVGTKKEEVSLMSSRLLKEYGEKNICNQDNPEVLSREMNIPIVKACQIVSCFELGKRFFKDKPKQVMIRTAKNAYSYLKDMHQLPKEQLRGLYLNSRYKLIHDEVISVGSLTSSIVHPREVFRPALEHSAAAIIIAHNHPSGSSKPTKGDIEVTEQLIEAGKILGIEILDHIIIAGNSFTSVPVKY